MSESYENYLENRVKELEGKVKDLEEQKKKDKKVPEHYSEGTERVLLNE